VSSAPDIGVALGERFDRRLTFLDPAVDVVDEDEAAFDLDAVDRRDLDGCELLSAGRPEQVAALFQGSRLLRVAVEGVTIRFFTIVRNRT
jgi:hypothetical protein